MPGRSSSDLALLTLAVAAILTTSSTGLAFGESTNGLPSWEERVLHAWVNRARLDPAAELAPCSACADEACYTPKPPLVYSSSLNRAARLHAVEMSLMGATGHDSACTLVSDIASSFPTSCAGVPSCACVGGTASCAPQCTTWPQRVQLFGITGSHEVLGSGTSPVAAFDAWMAEPWVSGCSSTPEARGTLLSTTGAIGFGVSGDAVVADLSENVPSLAYPIVAGSHFPRQGTNLTFHAVWHDGWAAKTAAVDIDGTCHPLTRERGTGYLGAWTAAVTTPAAACQRYYFVFRREDSVIKTWPETGSLGIGDGTCADFDASRPALPAGCPCLPVCEAKQCGDDQCGGSCGTCAASEECQSGLCVPGDAGLDVSADGPNPDAEGDAMQEAEAAEDAAEEAGTNDSGQDAAGDSGEDAMMDSGIENGGAGGAAGADGSAGSSARPGRPRVPAGRSIADSADDSSCAMSPAGRGSGFGIAAVGIALAFLSRRRPVGASRAAAVALIACSSLVLCGADSGSHCDENVQVALDGTRTDCSPARCEADSGTCVVSCAQDSECVDGWVCRDSACVDRGSRPLVSLYDEDGCNCRTAGRARAPSRAAVAMAVAPLLVVLRRRRVRARTGAAILAALAAWLFGCSSQEELPPGEVCEDVGYSISNRVLTCTGDKELAVQRWEEFRNEYQCLVKTVDRKIEEYYVCPVEVRRTPCDTVAAAGGDLDLWLGSVPICTEILAHTSGKRIPENGSQP